ncbi:MAG: hypothetical protein IKV96_02185 [Firmicutes bacterium]|nr:hypothetical protein [Bacillota bacterium]
MKKTIRENINAAYSLHDMNVCAFEVNGDDIVMRLGSGMIKVGGLCKQVDGFVEFHGVQWDFSYVYLMDHAGNVGIFSGKKLFLKDFIEKFQTFGCSIMDETYGYNTTKYTGYLISNLQHYTCFIDIYHEGDMVFVAEE